MSEVAKLVSLLSAGVPLRQADYLVDQIALAKTPAGVLLEDAKKLGASMAIVGQEIVHFEAEIARYESELSQAGAVPLQTRKLLLWLPVLSLVVGQLSGFGTLTSLLHPLGWVALLLAATLIWIGIRWSGKLIAPLKRPRSHPAINLMRLNLAVQSGQPLAQVDGRLLDDSSEIIALAKRTGAPLTKILASEIDALANAAQLEAMTAAKQLSIKLLIPMGLTVLPAFFILTVVPMFIGIGFK